MPARFKHRLEARAWYLAAREVARAVSAARAARRSPENTVVSLRPERRANGEVLLCYRIEPFARKPGEPFPSGHHNYWTTCQIAAMFLELGYGVDVVSHRSDLFVPRKRYAVVVDVRKILERIAPLLDQDCVKIMHLDTAHMLFHDAAEARRLLALQHRRGVTLAPVRFELPRLGIEHADCGITTGNEFTKATYAYIGKPIYRVPLPARVTCPWPAGKDFERCRGRFLFLSSHGLVHKGLDLLLEAFATLPDCHLTVCAPVDREADFVRAYRRELYETPNIETIGWIDIEGSEFQELTRRCGAVIHASCSEGGSTATIECQHAGLLPVVTYESSVDVLDFGVLLKSDSVEDIRAGVLAVAGVPASELERRARAAWEHVRATHTRERFVEVYRRTVETILTSFSR
jgi:glycosyltransferase involved in cell wall biosynthesis